MNSLLEYMLKISAVYAAAYIFYWLVLSRLTNYKSNRFYLLFTALFAFVIPMLRIDLFINQQTISNSSFINHIPAINITGAEYVPAESSISFSTIFLSVFTMGSIICLLHFIIQLLSFKKVTANAKLVSTVFNINIYHLDIDIMPFSFGNAVYVNQTKHSSAELDDIIKHESVHAHQQHTTDVILAEIICILNWYNPFVWLMKKAIKQNLEYLADDTVLKYGADKKSYQYLLLKVTGYSPLQIVSSLKFSSLKQRIFMMNKTRTSRKHLLKLLFVLPVIVFMMLAFRNTNTMASNVATSMKEGKFMLGWLTYNIADGNIDKLVKNAQSESLLSVGKTFDLTTIMNERDRIKSLLEKNGYNNISSHAITFMIDSTFQNKQCAIEINIDLKRKTISSNNSNKQAKDNTLIQSTKDDRSIASSINKKQAVEKI
ncbi:MAG TPA: M56 family metallopeptidase [Parafilimonas sp.]|nr:M56 family metallopeptidase [Parafilimonas sp.]